MSEYEKLHEQTDETEHCHCSCHDHKEQEPCHCHDHEEAHCTCHHDHEKDSDCGCGCGSALTVRSADIVLMDDNPAKVCEAIRIARRTSRIAGQNIVLSLGIKIGVVCAGVVLSAATQTQIPMGLAIAADVGAAILAVLNALRAAKRGV